MLAIPYTCTQAERSSDPPACSRACREDASHQEEEREDAAPKPVECIGKIMCLQQSFQSHASNMAQQITLKLVMTSG